jgi:mycofactocin precursor
MSTTDSGPDTASQQDDTDESDEETPEIEEDLIQEELRIDGICGVY